MVIGVREKVPSPIPRKVCTGLYCFDRSVWERIAVIRPSSRGELEITALLNTYVARGGLVSVSVPNGARWFDIGTPDRLLDAAIARRAQVAREGMSSPSVQDVPELHTSALVDDGYSQVGVSLS
jgi:glucose-1-phosphate thymidylyltransferase